MINKIIFKYWRTLLFLILIAFISLFNTNSIKPDVIKLFKHFDKLVHFLMYFTLVILFLVDSYYSHSRHIIKIKVLLIFILVTFYGVIMELLQEILTRYRSNDTLDIIANISGALSGLLIFLIANKYNILEIKWIQCLLLRKTKKDG